MNIHVEYTFYTHFWRQPKPNLFVIFNVHYKKRDANFDLGKIFKDQNRPTQPTNIERNQFHQKKNFFSFCSDQGFDWDFFFCFVFIKMKVEVSN